MSRPNVIVICSDQHRPDALGCYGNPICRTPALDRLATQGTLLERVISQNPVCAPARAAMATGCNSRWNGVPRNGYFLSSECPTLPALLADHGYATAAVGKTHLVPHSSGVPQAPFYGFQQLISVEDNSVGPYFDWVAEHYPEHLDYLTGCLFNMPSGEDFRELRDRIEPCRAEHVAPHEISETCNWGYGHHSPMPEQAHKSHWITDRAIETLDAHQPDAPLFLWVGYVDPHNPFDPPARYASIYDPDTIDAPVRREGEAAAWPPHLQAFAHHYRDFTDQDWRTLRALYYGGVTFMDAQIGRLIDAIEARLDMTNTILIYTSDHGEILGDHGIMGKWAYHFDSAIRVPMIARWDGHWQPGRRDSTLLEQTDLAPTLLGACGIDPPPMDGRSYHTLLAGQPHQPRGHAYVESYNGGPGDPTPDPLTWARTIRTDRWRATFYPTLDDGELYDLHTDPHELHNRWHDPDCQPIIAEHRRLLLDRLILRDHPLRNRPHPV